MKYFLLLALAASGVLGLAGCATAPPETREAASGLTVTELRLQRIEAMAKQRGTRLLWVNLPIDDGELAEIGGPELRMDPGAEDESSRD